MTQDPEKKRADNSRAAREYRDRKGDERRMREFDLQIMSQRSHQLYLTINEKRRQLATMKMIRLQLQAKMKKRATEISDRDKQVNEMEKDIQELEAQLWIARQECE